MSGMMHISKMFGACHQAGVFIIHLFVFSVFCVLIQPNVTWICRLAKKNVVRCEELNESMVYVLVWAGVRAPYDTTVEKKWFLLQEFLWVELLGYSLLYWTCGLQNVMTDIQLPSSKSVLNLHDNLITKLKFHLLHNHITIFR